jgi:hypothetical protein
MNLQPTIRNINFHTYSLQFFDTYAFETTGLLVAGELVELIYSMLELGVLCVQDLWFGTVEDTAAPLLYRLGCDNPIANISKKAFVTEARATGAVTKLLDALGSPAPVSVEKQPLPPLPVPIAARRPSIKRTEDEALAELVRRSLETSGGGDSNNQPVTPSHVSVAETEFPKKRKASGTSSRSAWSDEVTGFTEEELTEAEAENASTTLKWPPANDARDGGLVSRQAESPSLSKED